MKRDGRGAEALPSRERADHGEAKAHEGWVDRQGIKRDLAMRIDSLEDESPEDDQRRLS